jgi:hypothetical protein
VTGIVIEYIASVVASVAITLVCSREEGTRGTASGHRPRGSPRNLVKTLPPRPDAPLSVWGGRLSSRLRHGLGARVR